MQTLKESLWGSDRDASSQDKYLQPNGKSRRQRKLAMDGATQACHVPVQLRPFHGKTPLFVPSSSALASVDLGFFSSSVCCCPRGPRVPRPPTGLGRRAVLSRLQCCCISQ